MPQVRRYQSGAERQRAYRQRHKQPVTEPAVARPEPIRSVPPAPAISSIPAQARWSALVHQAGSTLKAVHNEMENYFQSRSEAWQEDERGEAFQEKKDALEEVIGALEEFATEFFTTPGAETTDGRN